MAEARAQFPFELLEGIRVVLLAAAASVIGYTAAFAYEAGLTGTLDLPVTMIIPQLPATVLATAALFISVVALLIGAEIVVGAIHRTKDPLGRAVVRDLLPLGLFGLFNSLIYSIHWQEWLWTFAPLLLIGITDFLLVPLMLHPKKHGYRAKVLAIHHQHWSRSMVVGRIASRVGPLPFGALLFILLFLYFAYAFGRSAGLEETRYLVTNDPDPAVVVRIYGNEVVTESFDPSSHRLSGNFTVRLLDTPGLVLSAKEFGHLSTDCTPIVGCHSPLGGPVGLP